MISVKVSNIWPSPPTKEYIYDYSLMLSGSIESVVMSNHKFKRFQYTLRDSRKSNFEKCLYKYRIYITHMLHIWKIQIKSKIYITNGECVNYKLKLSNKNKHKYHKIDIIQHKRSYKWKKKNTCYSNEYDHIMRQTCTCMYNLSFVWVWLEILIDVWFTNNYHYHYRVFIYLIKYNRRKISYRAWQNR